VKPSIRLALAISCLGVLILTPWSIADAASGKVESAHQRGPLVNASFTSFDGSGCIETDAFVSANRPTDHHVPSDATTTTILAVSVFEYDLCTDTVLLQAAGETETLDPTVLAVSNQFDRASVHATLPVTNIDTGAVFDITVNVSFVATSDLVRDHSNTNDQYPGGCHVLNRWKGTGRDAVASGEVSDGLTSFTPTSSSSAEIGAVVDGFVVIGCP